MSLLHAHIVPHPPVAVPAVGHGREQEIHLTLDAYRKVAESIAEDQPGLIIFITPHGISYQDYFHITPGSLSAGDFARFGAPGEAFELKHDEIFVDYLSILADKMNIPAGTLGGRAGNEIDHGILVPLHFINEKNTDYLAARVSVSGLSYEAHYRFGQCLREASESLGRRTVIVASGDLSHKLTQDGPYGFAKEGPDFDRRLTEAMRQGDFLSLMQFEPAFCESAAECGLRSFIIMAGALDGQDVHTSFHSYEGPFGVGYAVCSYEPAGLNEDRHFLTAFTREKMEKIDAIRQNEDDYVRLARHTLEEYVKTNRIVPIPDGLPATMLNTRSATFVSIKKDGLLRGCIGTTEPFRKNIAEEIIGNAISAGTKDPRFDPVTVDELPTLVYSVDVLSPSEPVDSSLALDPLRYGVIVANEHKRGLLLPHLDGVDTVEQQLSIALQKAGIKGTEDYTLSRFEVVRHH